VNVVDFHVHLAHPDWQARDPLVALAGRLAQALEPALPRRARPLLDVARGLAFPAWRATRDRALDVADRLLSLGRNRGVYLGDLGARAAPALDPLFQASFLRATPANLLESMDDAGISASVVLPIEPYTSTDVALALCRGHPRLVPFATVPTRERDPAAALGRMVEQGARGLKLHPALQNAAPDSPFHRALLGAASDLAIPVVVHTGCVRLPFYRAPEHADVEAVEPLLRAFPRARVVLAHMNLFRPDAAIEVARRRENVWLDTSWQPEGVVRRAHRTLGASRLVFGTDWPFPGARPRTALEIVVAALDRKPGALESVLWRNACRLLERAG